MNTQAEMILVSSAEVADLRAEVASMKALAGGTEEIRKTRERIDELESVNKEQAEEIERLTKRGDTKESLIEKLEGQVADLEDEIAVLKRREGDPESVAAAMVRETTSGDISWITDAGEREVWLDRARAAIGAMAS